MNSKMCLVNQVQVDYPHIDHTTAPSICCQERHCLEASYTHCHATKMNHGEVGSGGTQAGVHRTLRIPRFRWVLFHGEEVRGTETVH